MLKYYTLLTSKSGNIIYFPIKAPRNIYDDKEQFAGGYPAIFGGNDKGGVVATLSGEVSEESRRTLETDSGFKLYFTGQEPNNHMTFYWTDEWKKTGQQWGPPLNRDEGETLKVVSINIAENFTEDMPPDQVRDILIEISGCPGGTPTQYQQFCESETCAAFIQYIYNTVPVSK